MVEPIGGGSRRTASLRPLPTKKRRPSGASTSSAPTCAAVLAACRVDGRRRPPRRRGAASASAARRCVPARTAPTRRCSIRPSPPPRRRARARAAARRDRRRAAAARARPAARRCGDDGAPGASRRARRTVPSARGMLEHHVANLAPSRAVARLGAPHERRERVEAAAAEPELAVERLARQRGEEGRRRRHRPAAAMAQDAAVPERAHAVVLLADKAERRIDLAGVDAGQQRRERRSADRVPASAGVRAPAAPRQRGRSAAAARSRRRRADRPGRAIRHGGTPREHADSGARRCVGARATRVESPARGHRSPDRRIAEASRSRLGEARFL